MDGKTLANVDIGELTAGPQLAPETFAPIAGVVRQQGCMNPLPARLTSKQAPQCPEKARSLRIQGTASAQATIGVDGVPKIKKVVESVDQDLEASSVAAISKWRYDPALCNGRPVNLKTILQVNSKLSYWPSRNIDFPRFFPETGAGSGWLAAAGGTPALHQSAHRISRAAGMYLASLHRNRVGRASIATPPAYVELGSRGRVVGCDVV